MGIKNLNAFIKKHAYNGIKDISISDLQNKTIAVDTSIFMYKFMYSHRFIDNFIQQLFHLKSFNIKPIYIFDGKPPEEKKEVLDSRKESKIKISNKLVELEEKRSKLVDSNEIDNINKEIQSIRKKQIIVTKSDVSNLKRVFDILNVDYIQANCEADLLCCELYKNNKYSIHSKSYISIEKSILESNLGVTPQTEGNNLLLKFPELTSERRKDLVKIINEISEKFKISIRNIRRKFMDIVKNEEKDKSISLDESKKFNEDIQKLTDDFISKIDKNSSNKESEIIHI